MTKDFMRLLNWARRRGGAVILVAHDADDIEMVKGYFGANDLSVAEHVSALRLLADRLEAQA